MQKVVIGLGTGRCGTTTLAHLLNSQDDCFCTHERYNTPRHRLGNQFRKIIPPNIERLLFYSLTAMGMESVVGDVSGRWLDSVQSIMGYDGFDVKFICLKRDKDKTIDSLSRVYFRPIEPEIYKAMEEYYDDYYSDSEEYALMYPESFAIFPTEHLNSLGGQKEILAFAGFDNHNYAVGSRLNRRADQPIDPNHWHNICEQTVGISC